MKYSRKVWTAMLAFVLVASGLLAAMPAQRADAAFGQRITVSGNQFLAGGQRIWLNAANTPWFNWNDFGGTFNYSQWDNHFQQLAANGVNATRVWITCNGGGGITINGDGTVTGATAAHWSHLDSLFQIAQNRGVYIKATLISFDHTITNNPNYQAWRNMYNTDAGISSMVNNYVIPFVNRYKNNPYLFSIEPANEIEWVNEDPSRGGIASNRLIKYVASVAKAVHDNSQILVTQGAAAIKWNSTTVGGAIGNWWSDSSLQAQVNSPNARLDFYSPHFYDWQTPYWGVPFYKTPQQYGLPNDGKPVIIGETPAKGSQGNTTTSDYHNAYLNGWQGVMAWTSNGVDVNGDLTNLGPATRYMRDNYYNLVYPSGSSSDTQAPSAPANLASPAKTDTTVSLTWSASTDNVGVTGYDVYRGTTLAGSTASTSFTVTGLSPSTAYSFTVKAKDAAGNVSAASNALAVTTNAAPSADTAQFNFESGTHGFVGTGGLTLSSSADRAYAGAKSLKVALSVGSGSHYAKLANPANLTAGKTVTFRVWVPANAAISAIQPYVMDNNWAWTGNYQPYANLSKGAWNTITVTIPSNAVNPMKEIGVQVQTSGSYSGSVYVDSISW